MSAVAVSSDSRHHEATAIAAYLAACDAGLGAKWFPARYQGECALTRSTFRAGHLIGAIGDGAYVRKDATQSLSIRGNESIGDILRRFSWASQERAREWLAAGDGVLLVTAFTLKPKLIRPKRQLGSVTLAEVTPLYWRSVAFMLRREAP